MDKTKDQIDVGSVESKDDIEKIMSEIEELQQEMETTASPKAKIPEPDEKNQVSEPGREPSFADIAKASIAEASLVQASIDHMSGGALSSGTEDSVPSSKTSASPTKPSFPEPKEVPEKEYSDAGGEPWLEETLSHLKPESAPGNGGMLGESNTSHEETSLSISVKGDMTLKLKCDFEGQEVTVSFNQDAIRILLTDGTEFKVPIRKKNLRKVA